MAGFPMEGGCTCGAVRYRMEARPIILHACHCRWCQRETGSAFAHNAMVERSRVTLLQGEVETVAVPSESGRGQKIVRCVHCRVALWSHYPGGAAASSRREAARLSRLLMRSLPCPGAHTG
jgi:hypothetical protein